MLSFFVTGIMLGAVSLAPRLTRKQLKALKAGLLVAVAGILLLVSAARIFPPLYRRTQKLFTQKMGGRSIELRREFFTSAADAFSEYPFSGLGAGGYGVYHTSRDIRKYPHNIFLEVASELGVMGLALLMLLIAFASLHLYRLLRSNLWGDAGHSVNAAAAFFMFMFLNVMISGDINDNRLFFASIGLIYALFLMVHKKKLVFVSSSAHEERREDEDKGEEAIPI